MFFIYPYQLDNEYELVSRQRQIDLERRIHVELQRQQRQRLQEREKQAREAQFQRLLTFVASVVQEVCCRIGSVEFESHRKFQASTRRGFFGSEHYSLPASSLAGYLSNVRRERSCRGLCHQASFIRQADPETHVPVDHFRLYLPRQAVRHIVPDPQQYVRRQTAPALNLFEPLLNTSSQSGFQRVSEFDYGLQTRQFPDPGLLDVEHLLAKVTSSHKRAEAAPKSRPLRTQPALKKTSSMPVNSAVIVDSTGGARHVRFENFGDLLRSVYEEPEVWLKAIFNSLKSSTYIVSLSGEARS
jgi:hypothetical protein